MATDLSVLSDTYTETLNQWGLLLSVCTYGEYSDIISSTIVGMT